MTLNDMLDSIFDQQKGDDNLMNDIWNERYKSLLDVSIRSSRHYHRAIRGKPIVNKPSLIVTLYESVNHFAWGCPIKVPNDVMQDNQCTPS